MTEQKSIKSTQSKIKNTNQSWGGRFNEPVDAFVARFTASVNFDKRLYKHDILGSIAHASMLSDSGVISESEAKQIIEELQNIARDIASVGEIRAKLLAHTEINSLNFSINVVNDSAYLSTLAHEFCHGSGHKDRLNRKWLNEYSKLDLKKKCVLNLHQYLFVIGYK